MPVPYDLEAVRRQEQDAELPCDYAEREIMRLRMDAFWERIAADLMRATEDEHSNFGIE